MKRNMAAGLCTAGMLAFGVALSAQTPAQTPQTQPGAKADQQITITGCVQRESDYRSARDAGEGGVAGTGMGVGNEFVLVDAETKPASGEAAEAGATGTSGSAMASKAYELTGPNEGQASQYVGRRVEITGTLKAADTDATGRPTGGATAGAPPSGVDVTSKDLKLRELEVTSVREATGTCTPMKK